jgi:peroxiredoxin
MLLDAPLLMTQRTDLIMQEFGHDNPFGTEWRCVSRYEGQEKVGDVLCDVVYVEYDQPGIHARWFIGPDGLPRKVERLANVFPDFPIEARRVAILTLNNLDVNPSFTAENFRLKCPEGYESVQLQAGTNLLVTGSEALDWTLKTPGGESVNLASLRGNVVVIDFWGTWCPGCLTVLPEIQSIHEQFKGQPVRVVGISCNEREHADPAGYFKRNGYTYTLLLDGDDVARAYNVWAFPTIYVIDPRGKVAYAAPGGFALPLLRGVIGKLLPAERTASIESGS